MASNPYVNKVELADGTPVMDITDTTAEAEDVADGEVFYTAAGARSVGTLKTGNTRIFYGTCSTPSGTRDKVVTIPGYDEYKEGDVVVVAFDYSQTYAGTPRININGLGVKPIIRGGSNLGYQYMWAAGEAVQLLYDGSDFRDVRSGLASTSIYGRTRYENSAVSTATNRSLVPAALNAVCEDMISDAAPYSATSTYAVGDRRRHDTRVYECIIAIETAEDWNSAHWRVLPALQTQIDSVWGMTVSELLAL